MSVQKPIRFTKHARQKFTDLAELGFEVTETQVTDTVYYPDSVDTEQTPNIAQKLLDDRHVLRVVFVEETDEIRVITFYPGRKNRYAAEDAL